MAGVSSPLPDQPTELWEVHEHPGRPLDPGAILCSCAACEAAILAQAERTPRLAIALATACDRVVVTAEYLAEVMAVDRSLAPLLYLHDDWVRRLYVPVDYWIFPPRRWWSAVCHDDEEAVGRRHPRHRVAKRQSRANRARLAEAVDAPPPAAAPSTVSFTPLETAVAPWRRQHRRLLAEMAAWALERGHSVDLDLVALVLAARESRPDEPPLTRWTRPGVNRCLGVDSFNWCSRAQVLHPAGVPEALWQLLDFLVATDRLDRASDPLDELRKPLICYGGLDGSGRERSDDEDGLLIPCECFVTYRGPTHGELADLAAASAQLLSRARPLAE